MANRRQQKFDPVTVGQLKAQGHEGINIECHDCAHLELVSFEGYTDDERVIEIPTAKGRRYRCPICFSMKITARPNYDFGSGGQRVHKLMSKAYSDDEE